MILSIGARYGLMGVGYIASHPKDGNILAQTISKQYNIPPEYLLKILQQLCKADILQSKRGVHGGFVIGRDPSEITLLQIIEAIKGSIFDPLNFIEHNSNEPFIVRMRAVCEKARIEQNEVLKETTLADIIGSIK